MSIPAVILCQPNCAALRVAGLTVIDRLVVAAHRAEAASITVVSQKPWPRLERAAAMGIKVNLAADRPKLAGPALLLSSLLLVESGDLRRLMARPGRLISRQGRPLPAGSVTVLSAGGWEEQLSGLPPVVAEGVAEPVCDELSAAQAARELWTAMAPPAEGWVDRLFNRPVGRCLSKILVRTPLSPNQVSIATTLLGLVSARFFAQGDHRSALGGAILLQASAVVDCVDGDLARVMFKESRLGKWLDIVGDQVVHIGVFAGIGVGLSRAGSDDPVLPLAASAILGVVISFAVVLYGQLHSGKRRNTRLQKLIDASTNRDFSVLLVLLALINRLSWFLWIAAIGVHLFWLLALSAQWLNQPAGAILKPDRESRS